MDTPQPSPSVVIGRIPRRTPFNLTGFNEDGTLSEQTDQALLARNWDSTVGGDIHGHGVSTTADRPKEAYRNRTFQSIIPPSRRHQREKLLTNAQNIWTPSTKHDVTVRLEMSVADDVESRLEEFSRLKRLGHFHAAEQYYQDALEAFSDEYPIAIEYADMLVEQGAYERLHQFMVAKEPLLTATEAPDVGYETEWYMRKTNLQLISALSGMHTHHRLKEAYDQVVSVEEGVQQQGRSAMLLESSGLQVARYALMILSRVESETNLIPEHRFDVWSNCCTMYKDLVVQGRIWDARDLIVALLESDPLDAWEWIFNADICSENALSQFLIDWNTQQYDASTYLAVLDILVKVATVIVTVFDPFHGSSDQEGQFNKQKQQAAELCLQHACSIATCLKENDPQLVKCRPYLRWVLIEEQLHFLARQMTAHGFAEQYLKQYLDNFPGVKIWHGCVPIYVPIEAENPAWCMAQERAETRIFPLLESTLQAARELGDYKTEALCLWEIISRASAAPVEQFAQVSHLEKVIQRDLFSYRYTCLSRFLIAQTDQARKELLDELAEIRAHRKTSFNYSLGDWCEVSIEKALRKSLRISAAHTLNGQELFSRYLPPYFKDTLLASGLDQLYGLYLGKLSRDFSRARVPYRLRESTAKQDLARDKPDELLREHESGVQYVNIAGQRRQKLPHIEEDSDDEILSPIRDSTVVLRPRRRFTTDESGLSLFKHSPDKRMFVENASSSSSED